MKIYGTAKGGALSKKDFGVAFSAGGAVIPTVCYNQDNLNEFYEIETTKPSNSVIGAYIDGTSNPLYNTNVTLISIYTYADAGLSGGVFALGVWDSSGNLKNESDTFTVDDLPVGTSPALPTQTYTKSIDETLIGDGDTIGFICKTAPTGSGVVANGGYDNRPTPISNWKKADFVQGSTPVATTGRVLVICVNE